MWSNWRRRSCDWRKQILSFLLGEGKREKLFKHLIYSIQGFPQRHGDESDWLTKERDRKELIALHVQCMLFLIYVMPVLSSFGCLYSHDERRSFFSHLSPPSEFWVSLVFNVFLSSQEVIIVTVHITKSLRKFFSLVRISVHLDCHSTLISPLSSSQEHITFVGLPTFLWFQMAFLS